MEVITPWSAYGQFLANWQTFRTHLENNRIPEAKEALALAFESKYDGALGDMPAPAMALIGWAREYNNKGDNETAGWLVDSALKLAPGSSSIQAEISRYYLGGAEIDPLEAVSHYFRYLKSLGDDVPAFIRILARLVMLPLVLMTLTGAVLGLVSLLRYGPLLAHDFMDFFPHGKVPRWLGIPLCGLVLVLPLAAGLSIWWLIGWWLILFSIYMNGAERAMAYLCLASFMAAPWVIGKYAELASWRTDKVLQASLRVRSGVPRPSDKDLLDQALKQDPEDLLSRFALAQLLQRTGSNRAVTVYTPAFKDPVTAQAAYNNVAEIYLAAGDLSSVESALKAAMEHGPPQVEIYYNFGQYYNEAENLLEMEEQFNRADKLDHEKMGRIREMAGKRRINRVLASMPIPGELVRKRALSTPAAAREIKAGISSQWLGGIQGAAFMGAWAGAIIVVFVLQRIKGKWRLSVRCSSCGNPICLRCQRPAKDPSICLPCYNVFKGEGGVELKVKMEKRAQVSRFQDIWSWAGTAAAVLFPGGGHLIMGHSGAGIVLAVVPALIVSVYLTGLIAWPLMVPGHEGGMSAPGILMILFYLISMVVSVVAFRARANYWR